MIRPLDDLARSLGNTRKSMGDGTIGGRSRIATPFDTRRLRRASNAVSAAGAALPVGEAIMCTGSITVPAGGGAIVAQLDAILSQAGFPTTYAAGDPLTLNVTASWHIDVFIRWTDGYRGGGTLQALLDGTAAPEAWTSSPVWGQYADDLVVLAERGQDFNLEVTAADGLEHTAEIILSVATMEPLRFVAPAELPGGVIWTTWGSTTGIWSYDLGDGTWTDHGVPDAATGQCWKAAIGYDQSAGVQTLIHCDYDGNIQRATGNDIGPSSWTTVFDGADLPANTSRFGSVETDNTGRWIAAAVNDTADETYLYTSDDDGQTWALTHTLVNTTTLYNPGELRCDRQGGWVLFTNSISNDADQWVSEDGGDTWTSIIWVDEGVASNTFGGGICQGVIATGRSPRFGDDQIHEAASPYTAVTDAVDMGQNIYGTLTIARSPDGTKFYAWGGTNLGPVGFGYWTPDSSYGGGTAPWYALDGISGAPADEFIPDNGRWTSVGGETMVISGADNVGTNTFGLIYSDTPEVDGSWTWVDYADGPTGGGGTLPYDVFAYQPS